MANWLDEILAVYKGESSPVFELTEIDTNEYTLTLKNTVTQAGTPFALSSIATEAETLTGTDNDSLVTPLGLAGTKVIGYTNLASLPTTGVADTIYIAEDTDYLYRWDGSSYTQVGGGGTSPLTTKGDIYVYGTDDTRLPVGTDDYVLTADSSEAIGVAWKAASGGSSIVAETTLTTAAASVDFTGLDINSDGTYFFELLFYGGTFAISMRTGGDTSGTGYNTQRFLANGSGTTTSRSTNAAYIANNSGTAGYTQITGSISIVDNNGTKQARGEAKMSGENGTGDITLQVTAWENTATITNITQLTFSNSATDFAIGTVIRIWMVD